tara:strand:- start:2012 stop:2725 length:714 start_codon:yes stop_codon:yes gene_type:complete
MPQLNGKKYAYTKKGKEQYKKDKKKKYTLSSAKKKLASMGRRGDTELEHVNKDEQRMLKRMGASRSTNPRTGLKENFFGGGGISFKLPSSSGDVVRGVQSTYDQTVKKNLPKGLDGPNVSDKIGGVLKGAEKMGGYAVTELSRAPVKIVYGLAGAGDPYADQGSSETSNTSSSSVSSRTGGFGSVKRKKKKKRGMAESDTEGKDMSGGKMSKRGLRTPKRTGLNIVKKNSGSPSLGM